MLERVFLLYHLRAHRRLQYLLFQPTFKLSTERVRRQPMYPRRLQVHTEDIRVNQDILHHNPKVTLNQGARYQHPRTQLTVVNRNHSNLVILRTLHKRRRRQLTVPHLPPPPPEDDPRMLQLQLFDRRC